MQRRTTEDETTAEILDAIGPQRRLAFLRGLNDGVSSFVAKPREVPE